MTNHASHPAYRKVTVETPEGTYEGLKAAARANGITPQAISSKVRRNVPGWRYITTEPDWLSWNTEESAQ